MGERKILTLSDGSVVHMNGGSSVHFPERFDKKERVVRLEGEAFFEIMPDNTRPFTVQTGYVATRVLGTAFNIAARPDAGITVAVKTGKVLVTVTGGKRDEVQLLPGMKAIYRGPQYNLAVSGFPAGNAGSWTNNLLIFEQVSLEEICLALSRKYGVRFIPSSPALLRCQYSTRFDGLTLQQSIDKLSLLGNLHFSRKDSIITIKGTP